LFDGHLTAEGDGPTIGLTPCDETNEAVVRYLALKKRKHTFAAKCVQYLPREVELKREYERGRRFLEVGNAMRKKSGE